MNRRTALTLLTLGLSLILPGAPLPAQPPTPDTIIGSYYFFNMRILEIRQEGNQAIAEAPGDQKRDAFLFEQVTKNIPNITPDAKKALSQALTEHKRLGNLKNPTTIEFPSLQCDAEGFLKRIGIAPNLIPIYLKSGLTEKINFPALGKFQETWRLLPGGRLEVDAPIPVFPLDLLLCPDNNWEKAKLLVRFKEIVGKDEKKPDLTSKPLADFQRANPALFKRVCGFKIQNASELAAWKALDSAEYTQAALLFQKAAQEQPKLPFAYLGETWARIGAGEYTLARQALKTGRAAFTSETRPFLESFSYILEDQIAAYEITKTKASQDFIAFATAWSEKWTISDKQTALISDLIKKTPKEWTPQEKETAWKLVYAIPSWDILDKLVNMQGHSRSLPVGWNVSPTTTTLGKIEWGLPLYVKMHQLSRFSMLRGHLYLTQHDAPKAIYQYAASIRMGQSFRQGDFVRHIVGVAMEQYFGARPMSRLFEDASLQNPKTLSYLNQTVDQLLRSEPRPNPGRLCAYEYIEMPLTSDLIALLPGGVLSTSNFETIQSRENQLYAQMLLLKTACAVKAKSLKPPFPAQMDAAELPEDPFAKGQKLRYVSNGNDGAVVYSVGPDQKDDRALIPYDPTNGAASPGDISVRIR